MLPPIGLLTTQEMGEVVDLVFKYQDIFIGPGRKVGFTQGHLSIKVPGGRKSLPEKEHIAAEVKKLEREGQIRKSQSPWAVQVVLAAKKDGTKCFCND